MQYRTMAACCLALLTLTPWLCAGDPAPDPWEGLSRTTLRARVILEDGRSAVGARVRLAHDLRTPNFEVRIADDDGVVEFQRAPVELQLDLLLEHPEAGPRRFPVRKLRAGHAYDLGDVALPPRVSLHGTARDASGRPLDGLKLTVHCQCTTTGCEYVSTHTDSEGRYQLNVAPGTHFLLADGLGRFPVGPHATSTDVALPLTIDVQREFRGVVLHEDGSPAAGVELALDFGMYSEGKLAGARTVSDSSGRFLLRTLGFRPGRLILTRGIVTRKLETPVSTAVPECLEFPRGADLSVRIDFPPDVILGSPGWLQVQDTGALVEENLELYPTSSELVLRHLPTGVPLSVMWNGLDFPEQRTRVTLEHGEQGEVVIDPLSESLASRHKVAFRIHTPDSRPIAGARLSGSGGRHTTVSNDDGYGELDVYLDPRSKQRPPRGSLYVECPGFASKTARIYAPFDGAITVTLQPEAQVGVVVREASGTPVPVVDCSVELDWTGPLIFYTGPGHDGDYADDRFTRRPASTEPVHHRALPEGFHVVTVRTADGHSKLFAFEVETGGQALLEWVLPEAFTVNIDLDPSDRPLTHLLVEVREEAVFHDATRFHARRFSPTASRIPLRLRYPGEYKVVVRDWVQGEEFYFDREIDADTRSVKLQLPTR